MKILLKVLNWFAVTWITAVFLSLTIGRHLPFEFNPDTSGKIEVIVFLTFPLAVLMTLIPHDDHPQKKLTRNLKFLIAVLSIPFLAFNTFGNSMCANSDNIVVFISRSDTSYKIIKRYYDCGAWDSESPNYEFFKIKPLTKHFIFSKKVDTTTLNKLEWLKVKTQ